MHRVFSAVVGLVLAVAGLAASDYIPSTFKGDTALRRRGGACSRRAHAERVLYGIPLSEIFGKELKRCGSVKRYQPPGDSAWLVARGKLSRNGVVGSTETEGPGCIVGNTEVIRSILATQAH